MTNARRHPHWTKFLRVMFGQVTCSHCGHWSRPVYHDQLSGKRVIWYCRSCGALLVPSTRSALTEAALFFILAALTFPVVIMLPNQFYAWPHSPPLWLNLTVGCLDLLLCGMATTYLNLAVIQTNMTRTIEPHGLCLKCEYNLNHANHDRCPECGTPASDVVAAIAKWKRRAPVGTVQ